MRYFLAWGNKGRCSFPVLLLTAGLFGCRTSLSKKEDLTAQRVTPVTVRQGTVTLPTYAWGPGDLNPHFPWTYGKPIYPYPLLDDLGRTKAPKTYRTMVLENEYLRVTVIPELGGHVHSVYDKTAKREMLYVNHVVKPGLIGLRGAWISGGIEFNTGPQGHTVTCVSPVSCRFVHFEDGSKGIAIGTVEQVWRTQWVVIVRLLPGRKFLRERIRIANVTPFVRPYYFWNCTAVPNTDGMRFMYPMTVATDHAGKTFHRWPVRSGVDMSWSKNYRRPSSIFAYRCDQDFFGSYDYEAEYGVVAWANHYEVPGKKAWTWGRGDDGIRAMATLTDDGTWYNEVQTGPLRTQADYGLLEPHAVLTWHEWWYPVHDLNGYVFATRDVAVNVEDSARGGYRIRLMGTGTWEKAALRILRHGNAVLAKQIRITPVRVTEVTIDPSPRLSEPFEVAVTAESQTLAHFTYPLELSQPAIPPKAEEKPPQTASEYWQKAVLCRKRAEIPAAVENLNKALSSDATYVPAHLSLAELALEQGKARDAVPGLTKVLSVDPDCGPAHFHLARAYLQLGKEKEALYHAWRAVRYRSTSALGFSLVGQMALRAKRPQEAVQVLRRALGRDITDTVNWNLYAFALTQAGDRERAAYATERALSEDPLDPVANLMRAAPTWPLWDGRTVPPGTAPKRFLEEAHTVLEIAAFCFRLKAYGPGLGLLRWTSLRENAASSPISLYYAAYFAHHLGLSPDAVERFLTQGSKRSTDYVFPHRPESMAVLRALIDIRPGDWKLWYYLGCLYLRHYRKEEALQAWNHAVALGGKASVLYRNLGLVAWKLDHNDSAALPYYEKALAARPDDLTLVRDCALLYQGTGAWQKAKRVLERALRVKRYRSDVIELLARTYHHEGDDAKAAVLLDSYTFHAWEGQRSMHDIYREVHMSLGKKALREGDAKTACAEFKKALAYPENLGVGRPENAREPTEYLFLGKAYQLAGEREKAEGAWRKAAAFGSQEAQELLKKRAK